MEAPSVAYAIGLTPTEAVAFLEAKGLGVPPGWEKRLDEAHARAVIVSGMTRLDLLRDVKNALVEAVRDGKTADWFVKTLEPKLRAAGWTGKRQKVDRETGEVTELGRELPDRLRLIFRQNTQAAYMAGRYKAAMENAEERPWWQYIAVLDSRTRPRHAALNKKVFRFNDPFWKTHYPPNGFNCRCRVRALSVVQLQRENLTPESGAGRMVSQELPADPRHPDTPPRTVWGYKDPANKDMVRWTDAGFSYNPGVVWLEDTAGDLPGAPQIAHATNWKTLGLPDLRHVPTSERLPRPPILKAAESAKEAEALLAATLGFTAEALSVVVATPLGERIILRDKLRHMVEKRDNTRERYAGYVLPTLQQPFEVWLSEHQDGKLRENYFSLFKNDDHSVLVVVRVNHDGSLVWNVMQRSLKRMNEKREGWLIWQKKS